MSAFSRMSMYCPICRTEFDGMRGYGREWRTCCKECHDELEWRRTLAIMGKAYVPRQHPQESDRGTD